MSFSTVTTDLTIGQIGQLGAPIEPYNTVRSYVIADAAIAPGYGVVLDGDTVTPIPIRITDHNPRKNRDGMYHE